MQRAMEEDSLMIRHDDDDDNTQTSPTRMKISKLLFTVKHSVLLNQPRRQSQYYIHLVNVLDCFLHPTLHYLEKYFES